MSSFIRVWVVCIGWLGLIWLVGFLWFMVRIMHWYDHTPILGQSQTAIALTGGRARLAQCIELVQTQQVVQCFISGVSSGVSVQDIANVSGAHIPLSLEHARHISLGYQARTTQQNAQEIIHWMEENSQTDAYLLTSSYHMPRALLELYHLLPKHITLHPYPVNSHKIAYQKWWMKPSSWSLFISEYHKFCLAFMRGLLTKDL